MKESKREKTMAGESRMIGESREETTMIGENGGERTQ